MKKILSYIAVIFLIGILGSCGTENVVRKEVTSVTDVLALHPDSIAIQAKNQKFSFFLTSKEKTLFITSNNMLYEKFSTFLPEEKNADDAPRYITFEGTTINPFTIFSKSQLTEESERVGIDLNNYKICKLFNYVMTKGGKVIEDTRTLVSPLSPKPPVKRKITYE